MTTQKSQQMDLCTNCLNLSHCFYYKGKRETVHSCEEFACKDPGASVQELERFKRAEARFLSRANQGLFDDCGKPYAKPLDPLFKNSVKQIQKHER